MDAPPLVGAAEPRGSGLVGAADLRAPRLVGAADDPCSLGPVCGRPTPDPRAPAAAPATPAHLFHQKLNFVVF